jgi:putative SOS response-associated peptidase YedK
LFFFLLIAFNFYIMCGRFSLATPLDSLVKRFNLEGQDLKLPFRYNIAPSQKSPIIRSSSPKQLSMAEWGLNPEWKKEGGAIINARAETIGEKPTFASALADNRCLVLADGFYEWKEKDGSKIPYRFILEDRAPFAFAGLWFEKDGGYAFVIITTEPNTVAAPVHNRMPAILKPEDEAIWLDTVHSPEEAMKTLAPYPAEKMAAVPVSSLINNPANDAPSMIVPLHYGGA